MPDPDLASGILLFFGLAVVGGLVLPITRNQSRNMRFQEGLFFAAFLLRFGMSIVLYQFDLIAVLGDEDGGGWMKGLVIKNEWDLLGVGVADIPWHLSDAFNGVNKGYGYLLATLFHLTGLTARLPAAALNSFLGALTCVLVYRIASCLFDERVAARAGWWVCLFPSLILWSAQTIKEPVVIFFEAVALHSCFSLSHYGLSVRKVALCILAGAVLLTLRFYVAYICFAVYITAFLLEIVGKKKSGFNKVFASAALGSPILIFIFSGASVRMKEDLGSFDVKGIEAFRHNVSTGEGSGSGVKTDTDLNSPTGLILAEIIGGLHLLLAPFPWQLGGASLRMLFTLPELIIWWWLFFGGVIPGLRDLVRTRFGEFLPLFVFVVGLGLLYSVMFGNIGIVFRQRAQLLPWLLIFAEHGLQRRRARRQVSQRAQATRWTPDPTPIPQGPNLVSWI